MRLFLLGHRRELLQPLLSMLFFFRRPRPAVGGMDDVRRGELGEAVLAVRDGQRVTVAEGTFDFEVEDFAGQFTYAKSCMDASTALIAVITSIKKPRPATDFDPV